MLRLRSWFWPAVTSIAIVGLVVAGVLVAQVAYAGPLGFGWGGPHGARGGAHWMGWAGKGGSDQAAWPFADLRDGRPFTLEVTPGTVTAASSTNVTVQVKDGPSKSYAIDAQTHTRGLPAVGDQVVVIAKDGSTTATAVLGPHTPHGPGR